jgi:hypothetical protein
MAGRRVGEDFILSETAPCHFGAGHFFEFFGSMPEFEIFLHAPFTTCTDPNEFPLHMHYVAFLIQATGWANLAPARADPAAAWGMLGPWGTIAIPAMVFRA